MQELTSQDAEFLFSALPILFLVSLLTAGIGTVWLMVRGPRSKEQTSGHPEAAKSAGPKKETGGHSDAPPNSFTLQDRLEVLEGFLDENPPETATSPSTPLHTDTPSNVAPGTSEPDALPDAPPDSTSSSAPLSPSDEEKDAQLKSVVRHLKDKAA